MKLESDRMQNLRLTDKEFAKEIKVVMEERRWRTDDKPQSLVYEQMSALAFQSHPYRRPVIGWMNDLEHMTGQDARDWYQRWYAPNNAVLVVVGDVQPKAVFAMAQKYFGSAKAKVLPERKPQQEAAQLGIRRVNVKAPAKLPYLLMAYHVPVLKNPDTDWEPYALEMLGGVLDGNESARLNKALVRDSRIASSAGAGYDAVSRGPGLFLVDGAPSEGKSVVELEAAIREQIENIKRDGVTEDELLRVKAQVIAGQVYQEDSTFFQAMQIGEFETAGFSYKALDTRLEKLKGVTAAQIQEVARKYLIDDKLTVATLDPQPLDDKKPVAPPKGLHH